ncbi:hypothetical protein LSAT2_006447 [Lamellibrachia satsuma]|nr:hypothetical protein LSAT2_006447 [Lamellibrachia satsuma]
MWVRHPLMTIPGSRLFPAPGKGAGTTTSVEATPGEEGAQMRRTDVGQLSVIILGKACFDNAGLKYPAQLTSLRATDIIVLSSPITSRGQVAATIRHSVEYYGEAPFRSLSNGGRIRDDIQARVSRVPHIQHTSKALVGGGYSRKQVSRDVGREDGGTDSEEEDLLVLPLVSTRGDALRDDVIFTSFLYECKHATVTQQSKLSESRNIIENDTARGISSQQVAREDGLMTNQGNVDENMTDQIVNKLQQTQVTHFTKHISKIFSVQNKFVAYHRKTLLHRPQDMFGRDSNRLLKRTPRDKRNTKTNGAQKISLQQPLQEQTPQKTAAAAPQIAQVTQGSNSVNASYEEATASSSRNITDIRNDLQIKWNRSKQTTNATVCLSALLLLLLLVVYRSKMWKEKDDYWNYLAAPDSRFHLDDDWTYNRHNRPLLNINLKEVLKTKVQALQKLFRKAKGRRRSRGKYTMLMNIDEHESGEDELFIQPV